VNPVTLWARTLVDEFVRVGLREVCVAPGSRSTPLVLALARRPELTLRVHLDERSAAFYALGWGKASGRPAAVVTTSGTAVANLTPAVVEADASDTPLLLLTADRPPRLRGQDANQTVDQVRIFGSAARASVDVRPPSGEEVELRALRRLVDRAMADAIGDPAGPVHLNLPFDKPLEPERVREAVRPSSSSGPGPGEAEPDGGWTEADSVDALVRATAGRERGPALRIARRRARPSTEEVQHLVDVVRETAHGVVVGGPVPEPWRIGPAVRRFASATGLPMLADPLSGARWHGRESDAPVFGAYDLFLDVAAVRSRLAPELIVRIGRAPTSAALGRWLEQHAEVRQIVIDPGHRWKDHEGSASEYVRADAAFTLEAVREALDGAGGAAAGRTPASEAGRRRWRRLWESCERTTVEVIAGSDAFAGGHEGRIIREVVSLVPGGTSLFVSSSMPVRDLDAFAFPGDRDGALIAYGNRGASGIDGIVSSALGVAGATGSKAVAVVGDVAFCHDMNGLLGTRLEGVEVVFVVLHNDGGAIFHLLPIREHEPAFTRFFATPHGLDLRHAAALYGLPYQEVDVRMGDAPMRPRGSGTPSNVAEGALGEALAGALAAPGSHVLVVRTDRDENERRHRELRREIRDSLTSMTTEAGDDER